MTTPPFTTPLIVPLVLRQSTHIIQYPSLVAAGDKPIPLPITDEILVDARTLEVRTLLDEESTHAERVAIVRFCLDISRAELTPIASPEDPKVKAAQSSRDDMQVRLDILQERVRRLEHYSLQAHIIQLNTALSAEGLPMKPVPPNLDGQGNPMTLPPGFNGTSLEAMMEMSEADIDQALRAYGIIVPQDAPSDEPANPATALRMKDDGVTNDE